MAKMGLELVENQSSKSVSLTTWTHCLPERKLKNTTRKGISRACLMQPKATKDLGVNSWKLISRAKFKTLLLLPKPVCAVC
jgi:hypothetical protein